MAERNKPHIVVVNPPRSEGYTPHKQKFDTPLVPAPQDRAVKGAQLRSAFAAAITQAADRRKAIEADIDSAIPALYIEFQSLPGTPLDLSTLEATRSGIEVVAVRREAIEKADGTKSFIEHATVVVPDAKVGHFLRRFEEYSNTQPKQKATDRRHENMLDRVEQLRLATLKALWTDLGTEFPRDDDRRWWEVWLRRPDPKQKKKTTNSFEDFKLFCERLNISLSDQRLEFEDRIVALVNATARQLAQSIDVLNDIAEVRTVNTLAGFIRDLDAGAQREWVDDLLERTTAAPDQAPAVCILDSGVNRGHPLLRDHLSEADLHAIKSEWIVTDDDGHGTEMAGLALYGNVDAAAASVGPVTPGHRLESVRILPPHGHGSNEPHLFGALTATATSVVEIATPHRRRCFSLSIGASPEKGNGMPTSWSAALDALAAGREFDADRHGLFYIDDESPDAARRRLFIVSAGNVDDRLFQLDHLTRSDLELVEDPAQAWNAITVGAYTTLDTIDPDDDWKDWKPVAEAGELSPWSRTSLSYGSQWPNKPDVVFEGGNIAHNGTGGFDFPVPTLCLLTTYYDLQKRAFTLTYATSAACAQVAQIAGRITATYPDLQPETVRALIVHSADWTSPMRKHLINQSGKAARSRLVRRYGFGVPRVERALKSAADSLTLVVEGTIEPFREGKLHQIQFHTLPWPKAALAQLGSASVQLRVTLSYFVEPNPSRRGWRKKHRYQSHGLRFAAKGASESVDEFRKRKNEQALDDEETKPESPEDQGWFLGARTRERGSVHSDVWNGSAADLAERDVIAIYPVSGWWKDQPKRDRSALGVRYALIVSIETSAEDIDIWTPVASEVGILVEAESIALTL